MKELLIATTNPHKLEEIRSIFLFPDIELLSISEFDDIPEVVEDGKTFEANAIKKAVTLALKTQTWAMADDSGLEVDALSGAPGVHSARYAGEDRDYEANNSLLLSELEGSSDRSARFRCVIALSSPDGRAQVVDGRCEGTIAKSLRGNNGFGYDPLFIPEGYDETFGEMDASRKNSISHRARALLVAVREFSPFLRAS